jgi:glycosyltransferase involved in cell wall biosynthesis
MKILIVSPSFGGFGGIESFICALARFLNRSNYHVTLCFKKTSSFKLDSLLLSNAKQSGSNVRFVSRASRQLGKLIQEADIVHCQNPCIDVAFFAKVFCKPLVYTIHNHNKVKFSRHKLLRQLAFLLADARWYNSHFVWNSWEPTRKRKHSQILPIVSNLPVGVVPPKDRQGYLFIARWIENKGLKNLVDAYKLAKIDKQQWPLFLVGDGPLRSEIENRIASEQIGGIEIVGRVEDATRNNLIRHARWMVTPPHTNEDLGLTPIEARHVGVPCIVTRDGGLLEAAGQYSITCEPNNIQQLKKALEYAASMDESSYLNLSINTRKELLREMRPMADYLKEYETLCNQVKSIKERGM